MESLRIQECREAAGLNQSELARRIGSTQCSVSNWESGKQWPLWVWLPRIAAACGCKLDDLITEEATEDGTDAV